MPRIVLGHPSLGAATRDGIFIPVATPGIDSAGHLFRTDGVVLMPLSAVRAESLPSVANIVTRLADGVRAARGVPA